VATNDSTISGGLPWLTGLIYGTLFWLFLPVFRDIWHSRLRYAAQYHVSYSQVTAAKLPHDCDWFTSPLGDKNCHYDPEVIVMRTGHRDGTNQRVVSYDDGKTWTDVTNMPPVTPGVYVTWKKIED
jgi:hypothetical protein